MKTMRAFIYAAGRGTRLGLEHHKILLKIGDKSLLEWHCHHLSKVGVTELVIVTGHERERLKALFPKLSEAYGLTITEAYNPDFTLGSVLSFHVSLEAMEGGQTGVLIMDGDVLYPTRFLSRLIDSEHKTVLLLDQDYSTADDDPVLVPVKDGQPIDFMKRWQGEADLVGESIGFFKIDVTDVPLLAQETRARSVGSGRDEPFEEVLKALVLAGRMGFEDVTGTPWTEIDFPEDVVKAREEVYPALQSLSE